MVPRIIAVSGFALLVTFSTSAAQHPPNVDSLVEDFIGKGVYSAWNPDAAFLGCPDLQPWQEEAIANLLEADLDEWRLRDLGLFWGSALANCQDARLEQWYFHHFEAAPDGSAILSAFGGALAEARRTNPSIRREMLAWVADTTLDLRLRGRAGAILLGRAPTDERLRDYMWLVERVRLPDDLVLGETVVLLRDAPTEFLREMGQAIRRHPGLVNGSAFRTAALNAPRYAPAPTLQRFAEDVSAVEGDPSLTPEQRRQLEGYVAHLGKKPRQDERR